jgi:hypothetical protein
VDGKKALDVVLVPGGRAPAHTDAHVLEIVWKGFLILYIWGIRWNEYNGQEQYVLLSLQNALAQARSATYARSNSVAMLNNKYHHTLSSSGRLGCGIVGIVFMGGRFLAGYLSLDIGSHSLLV